MNGFSSLVLPICVRAFPQSGITFGEKTDLVKLQNVSLLSELTKYLRLSDVGRIDAGATAVFANRTAGVIE